MGFKDGDKLQINITFYFSYCDFYSLGKCGYFVNIQSGLSFLMSGIMEDRQNNFQEQGKICLMTYNLSIVEQCFVQVSGD